MRTYRKKKKTPEHWMRFRIIVVGVALGLCFAVIIARTVQLQIFKRTALTERAEGQYKKALHTMSRRGTIYDRNEEELAVSIDVASVCAYPRNIASPQKVAGRLAGTLNLRKTSLLKKLRSDKSFVWIKRHITPSEVDSVTALDIEGIDFISEKRRYYPMKTLAAQVIGFCGTDGRGLEGLEYYYEPFLGGKKSSWTVFNDALGRSFKVEGTPAATEDGYNVILTIDKNIQHIAEVALSEAVRSSAAKSGVAVVMVPYIRELQTMGEKESSNYRFF